MIAKLYVLSSRASKGLRNEELSCMVGWDKTVTRINHYHSLTAVETINDVLTQRIQGKSPSEDLMSKLRQAFKKNNKHLAELSGSRSICGGKWTNNISGPLGEDSDPIIRLLISLQWYCLNWWVLPAICFLLKILVSAFSCLENV